MPIKAIIRLVKRLWVCPTGHEVMYFRRPQDLEQCPECGRWVDFGPLRV